MLPIKTFIFFVLTVITLSFGAPVIQRENSTEVNLITRGNPIKHVPAIARRIKQKLVDLKPKEIVFYSGNRFQDDPKKGKGVHVKPDAKMFAEENGGNILAQILKKHKIRIPPKSKHLWDVASEAAALNANGEVDAVVGHRRKGSVYENIEKPILMKSPRVTKLTEHYVDSHGNLTPKVVKKS